MQQFREVSRTRTIYSTETHTSNFILNTFWNGKLVQFFQERCCVVMTGCQENKSCSKVLNFLERLDDRIRCTHKETVAYIHSTPSLRSFPSVAFETVPMFIWLTMALSRPRYKQCCQTGKNLMSIPKRKIPLRTPLSRYVYYCSYHVYPLTEKARWQTYCKGVNQLDAEVIPVVDVWKKQGPMCIPTFLDTLLSAVNKQGD